MGVDVTYVDVGGGLGVDYDGTNSTAEASVNYTPQEYANDVVYTMAESCREHDLPMPNLISESGRALTAHHAMLLLKVIDVETNTVPMLPQLTDDDHTLLHEMLEDWVTVHSGEALKPRKVREIAHDASFDKERARQYFAADALDLRSLAIAEQLHLGIMNGLQRMVRDDKDEFEDILEDIESALTDRYFCNFSLFQSLPDHWAIDQLFPVMPVHRLDERPDRMGTLQDVTCDSDGKIDRFVGDRNGRPSLELHVPKDDDDYVLGIFLTGAYQEILGDLHNLFGDTNAVHVKLAEDGRYVVSDIVHGDTVTEVLNYVQFHAPTLLATFRRKVQNASGITRSEANTFIADYVAGLEGYTYLEGEAAR
jgi:arginine decarboxylase